MTSKPRHDGYLPAPDIPSAADPVHQPGNAHQHSGQGHHRWMMIACCIPMLLVVAALVASGVAGPGAIIFAGVCLAMMWLMMKAMPGGH